MTKEDLLKLASEQGWEQMVESLPCPADKAGDPCESPKNAVKVACKDVDPLNPGTACEKALDALSDCMDANY